jgi:hypothetical protein
MSIGKATLVLQAPLSAFETGASSVAYCRTQLKWPKCLLCLQQYAFPESLGRCIGPQVSHPLSLSLLS